MKRHTNALILRRNWKDTREYLRYCSEVKQSTDGTISVYRGALDLLLYWARDCSLPTASRLRPIFPVWLATDNRSVSYLRKTCDVCRGYYSWAKARWSRYGNLPVDWIEVLRPARGDDQVHERLIYNVDEIRAIVALKPRNLTEERDLAAVAFLFLSGMRIGAFTTLPIQSVDTGTWMIKQWPGLGVRTKNSKAANTWLLDIQDLRQVVLAWDTKIREELLWTAPWYALIDPCGRDFALDQIPGKSRSSGFNARLRRLCKRAGIDYRSAHKLRHGHAVWALRRVTTMDEYKAVSQNLMHESLQTTDSIYSTLVDGDVGAVITRLSEDRNQDAHVLTLVRELLSKLEGSGVKA